jgi:hypothetical protein
MTDSERALQFWSVLALAARNQNLVSYKQLEQLTRMAAVGAGGPLGHISAYCRLHPNKIPQLNLIAVSQDTGKPEADFLQGVELEIEQARVFVYDWISHGAPTVEALEHAFETAHRKKMFDVKGATA